MTGIKKSLLIGTALIAGCLGANAENVLISTPESFQVLAVSPNGKWATGASLDAYNNTYAFRWNLESGSVEMLSSSTSIGMDVSNDGTVSGELGGAIAYWKDGDWHYVEGPQGGYAGGIGGGVSPDGQYMVGSVTYDDLNFVPYLWKNGKLVRPLGDGKTTGVPFDVNNDGTLSTGWIMQYNRTACLWDKDRKVTTFEDSPTYSMSPWNYGRKFSGDGSKMLYWGGWDPTYKVESIPVRDSEGNPILDEEGNPMYHERTVVDQNYLWCLYDVTNNTRLKVQAPAEESDLEFFDVSNSGMMVGYDRGRGYIHHPEHGGMYIDQYLDMRGVDATKYELFYSGDDYYVGQLPIYRVVGVSEDESVLIMDYYDTLGQPRGLAVKIGVDVNSVAASEIKVEQVSDVNAVAVTWKRPYGIGSVRGYYVYRDGTRVSGFMPLNVPYFYDRNLAPGTYTYQIGTVVSNGTENRSEEYTVEVKSAGVQKPTMLFGRQKGYNSAFLSWNEPSANIAHKRYYDNNAGFQAMGIYEPLKVEMGIRFLQKEMECYAGHKISEVTFVPMGVQKSWAINIYSAAEGGKPVLIKSQPVTGTLNYRQPNTVKLDTPIDIPANDLIVAVQCEVGSTSYTTLGAQYDNMVAGYSDLLRRVDYDDDFMSCYQSSADSGMGITTLVWAIDLGLTPESYDPVANGLVYYKVVLNSGNKETEVATTGETKCIVPDCSNGRQIFGISAVYNNGSESEPVYTAVDMAYSASPIAISQLDVTDLTATAKWELPIDDDASLVSYTYDETHTHGVKGTEENAWAFMVAHEYPAAFFRGYHDYAVRGLRFYPLADALYTMMLYKNGVKVAEVEVEDFTLGQWNEVPLPEGIKIDQNADYRVVLDCFDPEPNVYVIGIDGNRPIEYASDLFSTDNGESWRSFGYDANGSGSFMLGMVIYDYTCSEEPICEGFNVVVDGEISNESTLSGLTSEYTHTFAENDNVRHTIRVDAFYPGSASSTQGNTMRFRLEAAGLEGVDAENLVLTQNGGILTAEGETVNSLEVFGANGAVVAAAQGNSVDISALAAGTYAVRVATVRGNVVRKISVR